MLAYLGPVCRENIRQEGFWYYLFLGSFTVATIHYAVAKIFGPCSLTGAAGAAMPAGRPWCGISFPISGPRGPRRKLGWIRYVCFALSLLFVGAFSFSGAG